MDPLFLEYQLSSWITIVIGLLLVGRYNLHLIYIIVTILIATY
jgi:hypothetical protein